MRNTSLVARSGARFLSAIAIAMLVAACGGGDDNGGGGGGTIIADDPAPPMPSTVNFGIGTKDAARLSVSVDTVAIAYPALQFQGTWNRTANTWTLRGSTNVESGAQLFGAFRVQAIEPLEFTGTDSPSRGKLEFTTLVFPAQSVQAAFSLSDPPVLTVYGLERKTWQWDAFLLVWTDTLQPSHWRLASFGTTASGLVVDRGQLVLDLMATINANDLKIAGGGGYETACSPRPGASTGTRRIALANPDGQLSPGDTVVVTYTNCWIDDPTDDIDLMLNGTITMSGYIENKAPFSTGFDEVRFNALAENETETVAGAVTVMEPAIVTSGTMTLFVTP